MTTISKLFIALAVAGAASSAPAYASCSITSNPKGKVCTNTPIVSKAPIPRALRR